MKISDQEKWLSLALFLAFITIFYNLAEGALSIFIGLKDETLALFGFGLDSFVEVISGIGVLHMIVRKKRSAEEMHDRFERTALRVTGTAFYMLFAGLLVSAVVMLVQGHRPVTTVWGTIIGSISILTMWLLIHFKIKAGKKLNSRAIIADAQCTKACMYLSIVLLVASAGYELTGIGGFDALGSLGIAYFSLREGREAFEKARGLSCSCEI